MSTEIDGVNGIIKNTTSDGDITIKGNDGGSEITAMTIDMSAGGKVGIGTASPATKLTIDEGGEPPAEGMLLLQANSSSRQLRIQPPTNSDNGFIDYRGGNLTFLDDGTEVARFQATTGFGIGTTSVSNKLEIASDSSNHVRLKSATTAAKGLSLLYDNGNDRSEIRSDQQGVNQKDLMYYALNHNFGRNASDINFKIDESGNVAIGGATNTNATMLIRTTITDDNTGLTIVGAGSGTGARLAIADAGSTLSNRAETLEIGYDNSTDFIFSRTGQDLIIGTNAAERMRIEADGGVAIGVTSTVRMLSVKAPAGFSQYTVDFENASSSAPYGILNRYSGAAPDSGSDYHFLNCTDTSATRLRIESDGDVNNHDNAYGAISDERIKQDIRDSNSQWNDIKAIKVRNYKKKDDVRQYGDNAWEQIGVIAQELEVVSPKLIRKHNPSSFDILSSSEFGTLYTSDDAETQDAVLYTSDDQEVIDGGKNVGDIKTPSTKQIGEVKEIKEQVKSVNYSILYMKAIKALQEAQTRIETLETKVTALEG